MKTSPLLLAAALFSALPVLSAGATVLLDDTFADGNRTAQNLPGSAALFHGGSNGNQSLTVVSQALELNFHTTASQLGQFVGYFTNSGVTTLNVGDKLSLSFSLSASAVTNEGLSLRIGLFNSGGSRVSADTSGIADAAFSANTGYSFWNSVGTGSANGGFRQRTGTNNTLWATGANTNLSAQTIARLGYEADTAYTLTFQLERTSATDMVVTFSDSAGHEFARTDTADIFTGFDTFSVFAANGSDLPDNDVIYTFDNFLVTYTPVPEPGSAALFAPALAGLMALRRRSPQGK